VTESGEAAGRAAASYATVEHASASYDMAGHTTRRLIPVETKGGFLYVVPGLIDIDRIESETVLFFRSESVRGKTIVRVLVDGAKIFQKQYNQLRPPEMERVVLDLTQCQLTNDSKMTVEMESL
jgi:hypothetical protein